MDYKQLFAEIKTIAVVGYSDVTARAGHFVPAYLAQQGYDIIAVNPKYGATVDGFPCYPDLASIPAGTQIDVVDVFRNPSAVPGVAEEALKLDPRPKYFWMQPGAESEAAATLCRENGITPILGDCMLAEHKKL